MNSPANPPLVSVCIQTYQHATFIKACLDSVLCQQTNFPFEIIVGEDDSTDGTREICKEYAEKNPGKIRLILRSEKDKIYIDGIKTGRFNFIENLKAAKGRYIALLDGDDYWLTNHKLQKQVDLMEVNTNCSMCFHQTLHCRNSGAPYLPDQGIAKTDSIFGIDEILNCRLFTLHTSNCLYRASNIDRIPDWFYEVPFLDFPIYLQNAQQGKIGYIAEPLSVYRIHHAGMWLSVREPGNYQKMWRLYSIMAPHFNGDIGRILLKRRNTVGKDLIRFYNNHLWENREWLKKDLELNKFPGDDELYKRLCLSPTLRDYLFNCGSYSKKMIRRVIKGVGINS